MEQKERQAAEFKALQDEMLENSRKIYQIITSTIALCAGLIGYCFTPAHFPIIIWGRPFALLSPFLILVPAMILIQSNQHSTVRIAAFLEVAFEKYKDRELPGWQTAMHWCRETPGPTRIPVKKRTLAERLDWLRERLGELTFVAEPATSNGRHLHAGLRGILYGIALVSTSGSVVSWWWLYYHDHFFSRQHFWMLTCYALCALAAWWLFLLAYRDMREGWDKKRFAEWRKHWEDWAKEELKQKKSH
jgi:hypothetical protein